MITKPTREQAIQMARDLIDGRKTTAEVWEWVTLLYSDNRLMDTLEVEDPLLKEFISTLGMADLLDPTTSSKLYGKEDYVSWLEDFLSELSQGEPNTKK